MSKPKSCGDGSFIEWVDRETVRYIEGDFSVLVWIDFEPGFFSRGRVLKSSSINTWDTKPIGDPSLIDQDKKKEIIDKIQKYYVEGGVRCRVED